MRVYTHTHTHIYIQTWVSKQAWFFQYVYIHTQIYASVCILCMYHVSRYLTNFACHTYIKNYYEDFFTSMSIYQSNFYILIRSVIFNASSFIYSIIYFSLPISSFIIAYLFLFFLFLSCSFCLNVFIKICLHLLLTLPFYFCLPCLSFLSNNFIFSHSVKLYPLSHLFALSSTVNISTWMVYSQKQKCVSQWSFACSFVLSGHSFI